MEKTDRFDEKLARIFAATQARGDTALAHILGIKPPSVAAAKKRRQIPTGWVEDIAERLNISADWLFFGRGPMHSEEVVPTASNGAPSPQPAPQTPVAAQENACAVCAEWKRELETERRELTAEVRLMAAENRELTAENRHLWKENGELREKCARLEERQYQHSISHDGGELAGASA